MGRAVKWVILLAMLSTCLSARAQGVWWGYYHFYGDYYDYGTEQTAFAEQMLMGRYIVPLVDPRLGTVDLGLGLVWDYSSQTFDGKKTSGSATGIGHYDIRLNLFPYRNFPLTLYYSREQRKGYAGSEPWWTDVVGARLLLRTTHAGTWWINGYVSRYQQAPDHETIRSWTVQQTQTFDKTAASLDVQSQSTTGFRGDWSYRWGSYSTITDLPSGGRLYGNLFLSNSAFEGASQTSYYLNATWDQPLTNRWRLMTSGGVSGAEFAGGGSGRGLRLSGTAYYDSGPWHPFGGMSLAFARTNQGQDGESESYTIVQGYGGLMWQGPKGWTLTADASFGRSSQPLPLAGGETSQSYHLGVAKSAGLPGWLSSLAFTFRDLSFERRMADVFPPGYQTPEAASLRQEYYQRQRGGQTQFSLDYYHSRDGYGTTDSVAAVGGLNFNHTLSMQVLANVQRTNLAAGGSLRNGSAYLQLTWTARTNTSFSLFGSMGQNSGQGLWLSAQGAEWTSQRTTAYGATFNSMLFRRVPLSVTLSRTKIQEGETYNQAWVDAGFIYRDLQFRFLYNYSRYAGGASPFVGPEAPRGDIHTLHIDLYRLFRGTAYPRVGG